MVLVSCGAGTLSLDSPDLAADAAKACTSLVDNLPPTVGDLKRRDVRQRHQYAAAYGDPALVVACGVPAPAELDAISTCQRVDGVDWFVPETQVGDQTADVVATTVGRRPRVQLRIPAEYRPPDAELVDVAAAVKASTRLLRPCG